MSERYRVEEMAGTPDELRKVLPPECCMDGGWCIVRDDDELMSIYDTREQAEAALREANNGNTD